MHTAHDANDDFDAPEPPRLDSFDRERLVEREASKLLAHLREVASSKIPREPPDAFSSAVLTAARCILAREFSERRSRARR